MKKKTRDTSSATLIYALRVVSKGVIICYLFWIKNQTKDTHALIKQNEIVSSFLIITVFST